MAEARGPKKYDNRVVGWAGLGHTFCGRGRGLMIQLAGWDRAGSAQLLRARTKKIEGCSNNIIKFKIEGCSSKK